MYLPSSICILYSLSTYDFVEDFRFFVYGLLIVDTLLTFCSQLITTRKLGF